MTTNTPSPAQEEKQNNDQPNILAQEQKQRGFIHGIIEREETQRKLRQMERELKVMSILAFCIISIPLGLAARPFFLNYPVSTSIITVVGLTAVFVRERILKEKKEETKFDPAREREEHLIKEISEKLHNPKYKQEIKSAFRKRKYLFMTGSIMLIILLGYMTMKKISPVFSVSIFFIGYYYLGYKFWRCPACNYRFDFISRGRLGGANISSINKCSRCQVPLK